MTHIYITRPKRINSLYSSDTIQWHRSRSTLGSGNVLVHYGTKTLPKPMLTYHWCDHVAFNGGQFYRKYSRDLSFICVWKLQNLILQLHAPEANELTHWGRVTHICKSELIIIGSDNGLLPGRRQAIIWTNAGILLIGPLGGNFSEILIEIHRFSFKKVHLKMSGKWQPFCLGLNELTNRFCLVDMAICCTSPPATTKYVSP